MCQSAAGVIYVLLARMSVRFDAARYLRRSCLMSSPKRSSSPPAPAKHRHLLPASHHYLPTTHTLHTNNPPHHRQSRLHLLFINLITQLQPRSWPKKTRPSASKRQRSCPKTSPPKPKPSTRRSSHNRPEQVIRRCASLRLRCWDWESCTEITRGHKTWPT